MRRGERASSPFARWLRPLLLVAVFSSAGCADGRQTCIFTANAGGGTRMSCPDGSSVLLPSIEQEQPPGAIRGTARFFGREDHTGIRVALQGREDDFVLTGADGSYIIEEVPAGHHKLTFRATGYEEVLVKDLMVLPGAWTTEHAELRTGRRLIQGGDWNLIPAPKGTRFLAQSDGGELHLVNPVAASTRRIAGTVEQAVFSPDGDQVLYTAERGDDGTTTLYAYRVGNGAKTKVADKVRRWALTADGETFAVERWPEDVNILETWHQPSGRRAAVGQNIAEWKLSGDGGSLLALAATPSGLTLVVWDLSAAGGTGLGNIVPDRLGNYLPDFAPDDRSFVFRTGSGDTMLWNGALRDATFLAAGVDNHEFSPDGTSLLYFVDSTLFHLDLRTFARVEIATATIAASFSPTGSHIAYLKASSAELALYRWERESRASRLLTAVDGPGPLRFDPSGAYVFYRESGGRLLRWSEGGTRILSNDAPLLPAFHPDGSSMLFHREGGLVWSETGGTSDVSLGAPVDDFPVLWSPDGRHLLYVVGRPDGGGDWGNGWLFDQESRQTAYAGTAVHLDTSAFLPDGTLLALQHTGTVGVFQGELVRGGAVIASGVRAGFDATPDADRILLVTDGLPIREPDVLALWEEPRLEPGPCGEPVERGGLVAVDSYVHEQLVGADFLVWTNRAPEEIDRAGVYVSHFPRDLPPLEEPTVPEVGETNE